MTNEGTTAVEKSSRDVSVEDRLSENALNVFKRRYVRRGPDGEPVETVEDVFRRVAHHVAAVEEKLGGDPEEPEATFFNLMTHLRFLPNSPTFTGAGTPLAQLAACFTADTRVTTGEGPKRIADLRVGDLVLTHKGRYRQVTECHQRKYEGELLRIKTKLIGRPIEVTPEHPILTPAGWVRAGDLQTDDEVAVGVPAPVHNVSTFDLAELPYSDTLEVQFDKDSISVRRPSVYQNSGLYGRSHNRFIEVTTELARLCGYYVAEGTIGPDEEYVRFTFNKNEEDYIDDVAELLREVFGCEPNCSYSGSGNWIHINLHGRAIATWFREQFRYGSGDLPLPIWLQYAEREIQQEFVVGLLRGDGFYSENEYVAPSTSTGKPKTFRAFRLTLANPGLIQQVWQMLLRLGYDAAVRPADTTYVTENASATAQISMPPLSSRDLISLTYGVDLPEPDRRYVRKYVRRSGAGQTFLRVERIERANFSGFVYNCEVEEDHSYVAEGIVVHNCFVLPISDDMGRCGDGIFETLRDMALIQQTGGGTGFSFSHLRPMGAVVRSSGGQATGPVGFMQVYDTASEIISQGGARRGANMAVLRADHPDIREFIRCKTNEYAITNFNISVGVTDAFMRAVSEDDTIDLINPQDGEVWETVPAREIFEQIVSAAHRNGEPGMLFLDTANRDNPCPHLGEYEATNPCGEQFLLPYENCCLGSVNLARHVRVGDNGRPVLDWEKLAETVQASVRFLDDVIDANGYVPAVPQLEEAAHRTRRIGLGIMGLGDVLYHLRVRYGSEEGQELAAQVMEFIRYHAMQASIELARERGPFPAIEGSIYDPDDVRWVPPEPLTPYERLERWGRPPLDWNAIVEGIRRHGIRNAAQTTIAPTGTRATVAGCEAYGCEPVFALAYVRHMNPVSGGNGTEGDDQDVELKYTSPIFRQALKHAELDEQTRERIVERVARTGSCQEVDEVPEAIREVFVVAQDIPAEEHVRMQASLQAFVDASISKTINFPADARPDDVAQAFRLAWKLGCKGLTVYVTGSREKVVLETEETRRASKRGAAMMVSTNVRPRPHSLEGKTYRLDTPLGTAYITVNVNGEGEPFEVFLNVGKAGSDTAAVAEAIGRLISLALRIPSPLSSTRRLKQVVKQLKGIGGGRSLGFGRDRVRSLPDGVAHVLAEHLGLAESPGKAGLSEQLPLFPEGDLCPECGQATLVYEEGCQHCYACGYSEC